MKGYRVLGLIFAISTTVVGAAASAQDAPPPASANDDTTQTQAIGAPYEAPPDRADSDQTAQTHQRTLLPIGLGLSVGGGWAGFLDTHFNDIATPGGTWNARLLVGTDAVIGAEFSYMGTSNQVDDFGLGDHAYLLASGLRAAFRLSLLPASYDFRPYLLAGAGWKHYSIQNTKENTSAIRDSDELLEIPLAGGIYYDFAPLFADVRLTFAPAFGDNLVRAPLSNATNLSTWSADANVGVEF